MLHAEILGQADAGYAATVTRALARFGEPMRNYGSHVTGYADEPQVLWHVSPFALTRDADIREESNYQVILADLTSRFGDRVAEMSIGHFACGWVEHIVYQPTGGSDADVYTMDGDTDGVPGVPPMVRLHGAVGTGPIAWEDVPGTIEAAIVAWHGHLESEGFASESDISERESDAEIEHLMTEIYVHGNAGKRIAERVADVLRQDDGHDAVMGAYRGSEELDTAILAVAPYVADNVDDLRDGIREARAAGASWADVLTHWQAARQLTAEDWGTVERAADPIGYHVLLSEPSDGVLTYVGGLVARLARVESAGAGQLAIV